MTSYYQTDLARVHDRGFGFHGERCAPGILALLEPVRRREGVVLELGCGSGALTRWLVDAGHRVIATDGSPAMLDLARAAVPGAVAVRRLVLPDDPLPPVDAVVGVGQILNYLDDGDAVERALVAAAGALRPGGVLAIDAVDPGWTGSRHNLLPLARVDDAWAIFSRSFVPAPGRLAHELTTFVRTDDGSWRRADERHDNVLIDPGWAVAVLADHGVDAAAGTSFGTERLPAGIVTLTGRRRAAAR